MNKLHLKIILLSSIFCIFLAACSNRTADIVSKEEEIDLVSRAKTSKLIVLDVYHKHCKSCKLIEPEIKKTEKLYSKNSDVAFLKYDLSNPISVISSRKIAKKIGLEKLYKQQRYSGVVLLIDTSTKEVLDTLIGEEKSEKYTQVIENTLKEIKEG